MLCDTQIITVIFHNGPMSRGWRRGMVPRDRRRAFLCFTLRRGEEEAHVCGRFVSFEAGSEECSGVRVFISFVRYKGWGSWRLVEIGRVDVACVQGELTGEVKMVVLAVLLDIGDESPLKRKSPVSLLVCSLAVLDCWAQDGPSWWCRVRLGLGVHQMAALKRPGVSGARNISVLPRMVFTGAKVFRLEKEGTADRNELMEVLY